MSDSEIILTILIALSCIPTLASLSRLDQWWIRGFDFPRLQISLFHLILIFFCIFYLSYQELWHYLITGVVVFNSLYQGYKIFPYTILSKQQVLRANEKEGDKVVSVLVSNILMDNDKYHRLLDIIQREKPNILLVIESDKKWENALKPVEQDYPYLVKVPQDNLYGMHLYSNLPLKDMEVKRIVSKEIPSIHGYVQLKTGKWVRIYCLHPKPPSPTEDETSTNRDAELLVVGKNIKENQESTFVLGDLNDVAWSRTTRLFQATSGLLDPRIGRGFFNTFHTKYPCFRWPLDHVFHSDDFKLVSLRRLPNIGSDHFPILIKLCHEPKAVNEQEEPQADSEEKQWADEKIAKGRPRQKVELSQIISFW